MGQSIKNDAVEALTRDLARRPGTGVTDVAPACVAAAVSFDSKSQPVEAASKRLESTWQGPESVGQQIAPST